MIAGMTAGANCKQLGITKKSVARDQIRPESEIRKHKFQDLSARMSIDIS